MLRWWVLYLPLSPVGLPGLMNTIALTCTPFLLASPTARSNSSKSNDLVGGGGGEWEVEVLGMMALAPTEQDYLHFCCCSVTVVTAAPVSTYSYYYYYYYYYYYHYLPPGLLFEVVAH